MAFKNGVVIVMSCSKGGINKVLPLAAFSAWKSKNFLYFCNQVLADRRDTTLLRQKILSPGVGAGMILVGKNIQH